MSVSGSAAATTAKAEGRLAATEPVPDRVIEATLRDLANLCRRAPLDLSTAIGRLVINRFYGRKIERWRKRSAEDPAYRKLIQHPDLPVPPASLARSIAIYELSLRLPELRRWKTIGVTHMRVVLALRPEAQVRLLRAAEKNGWTVADLEAAVAKESGVGERPRGRPRLPEPVKALRQLERLLEVGTRSDAWESPGAIDRRAAENLCVAIARLRSLCDEIERRCRGVIAAKAVVPVGATVKLAELGAGGEKSLSPAAGKPTVTRTKG